MNKIAVKLTPLATLPHRIDQANMNIRTECGAKMMQQIVFKHLDFWTQGDKLVITWEMEKLLHYEAVRDAVRDIREMRTEPSEAGLNE